VHPRVLRMLDLRGLGTIEGRRPDRDVKAYEIH
jgi:hypothetical protein